MLTGQMRKGGFIDFWIMPLGVLLHGPIHLLISSALEICFAWDSEQEGWIRAGLPPVRMMARPVQHFRGAIFSAWQDTVAAELCKRNGFRGKFGFEKLVLVNYLSLLSSGKETKCH